MVSTLQRGRRQHSAFVATVQRGTVASYRFDGCVQVAECVGRDNGNLSWDNSSEPVIECCTCKGTLNGIARPG